MQVPEECPLCIAQLIDDCLENPPRERPSARQAYDIIKTALAPLQALPPAQEVCFTHTVTDERYTVHLTCKQGSGGSQTAVLLQLRLFEAQVHTACFWPACNSIHPGNEHPAARRRCTFLILTGL